MVRKIILISNKKMSKKKKKLYSNEVVTPICKSATYYFEDTKEVIKYHKGKISAGRYGRYDNPNWIEVEDKLAKLDDFDAALLFPSGMSAIATTFLSFLQNKDKVIYTGKGYRNIRSLCGNILSKFGVESTSLSPAKPERFLKELRHFYDKKTKIVFLEIPSNPHLHMVDLESVRKILRKDTILIVDSTFATPINFSPKKWGADLVIHSCGKYLGGHADIMAGSVAGSKEKIEIIRNYRNVMGCISGSENAFLLNRSLATLKLRMDYLNKNGMKLAKYLNDNPNIKKVYYSGLPSHSSHELAKKYLSGHGGVVSFELEASISQTAKFVELLKIPFMGTNFGSNYSMVEQCAIFTYFKETKKTKKDLGISDSLIRYSIGFEDIDIIIADIEQAIRTTFK